MWGGGSRLAAAQGRAWHGASGTGAGLPPLWPSGPVAPHPPPQRSHRTPRCPLACHRPPCAGPLGTGSLACRRTLGTAEGQREGRDGSGPPPSPGPASRTLTEPCLLVPLHLDGQAEVRQLHGRPLALAGQKQILGLRTRRPAGAGAGYTRGHGGKGAQQTGRRFAGWGAQVGPPPAPTTGCCPGGLLVTPGGQRGAVTPRLRTRSAASRPECTSPARAGTAFPMSRVGVLQAGGGLPEEAPPEDQEEGGGTHPIPLAPPVVCPQVGKAPRRPPCLREQRPRAS